MKINAIKCALGALILLLAATGCSRKQTAVEETIADNAIVSQYSDKTVSRQQITTLLESASRAQCAREVTPWKFIAVGADKMSMFSGLASIAPGVGNAKAAIVVCGISARMGEGDALGLWQQDCAAATQNIVLNARAMGMGANWLRVYPMSVRVRQVAEAMKLDPGVVPFAIITLGYPEATSPVKDQWKPAEIVWKGSFAE